MEFASAYIFLLKMRFENNLQFDIQIAKSFEDYRLPPMAVQVLIENAVKHNEISDRKPLTIHIVTNNEGYLSVSNDIQPKRTAASGTGIGLVNLAKRYRLLFKSQRTKSFPFAFLLLMKYNERQAKCYENSYY